MPDFRFDTDTAVTVVDECTAEAVLRAEWNVDGRILNGGYLQAVVLRAVLALLPRAGRPLAISTTFAAAATPGPATVTALVLRAGSTVTSVSASLLQPGGTVLTSMITLGAIGYPNYDGALGERPDPRGGMPAVTGPKDSLRIPPQQLPGPPGLAALIDYAFVPEASGWLRGDVSAGPAIRCWLMFRDGRPVDVLAAAAFVDIAPPVCFATGRFGWAPTLQLQTALFAEPAPGPMLLDLVGDPYDGPLVAEQARLWDSTGQLVAGSRQIALAPRE